MHAAIHKAHAGVHKHLKLQHHRHTGRRLHHKHTSYRALAAILALSGALMIAITITGRAAANELFGVSAVVPGPVPSTAAIITTIADGDTLTSKSTLVAGGCPVGEPPLTVVLLLDGAVAGSAICNAQNNFALPVILAPGAHSLVMQTYNSTYSQGPDSTPIQVTYKSTGATTTAGTLALAPATPFTMVQSNLNVAWQGKITGGTPPYKVLVDWGDGNVDSHTADGTDQHFTHHYAALASRNARIAVTDARGAAVQQQYAATAYEVVAAPIATLTRPTTPNGRLIAGLYGLFLTLASISAIVWLEAKHATRQELAVPV